MTFFTKYRNIIFYLMSFLFPILIMFGVLLSFDITWGSETTILASDGFHQYVIFDTTLRDILHGKDSLFYSFTSGLGLNFYALMSYYLGSFFSPLTYFFDKSSMPDAVYLFTLLKFGLIGLSSYFSLHKVYNKLERSFTLVLSTSLALMSFLTSQLELNKWLDVFILIPLILLGLHRLINKEGTLLYYATLTILFIQNYYFGFMTALFLLLWFFVQSSWDFKHRIKRFLDFSIVSILSTLSSMVMLLPTYLDLKTHGETFDTFTNWLSEDAWWLDIFAKNMVGAYDTTQFHALPMIAVGLIPMTLSLIFFFLPSIKWSVKLSYGILLIILIASFYLEPLDLFWQGMHAPNMFLHRYAWVFSFILIYMSAETLSRTSQWTMKLITPSFLFLAIGLGLTFFYSDHYPFLTSVNFMLTGSLLLAYFIILFSLIKNYIDSQWFKLFLSFFMILEVSLNSFYYVKGLSTEWNFPSREGYTKNLTAIDSLVNFANKNTSTFFRMERLLPQTGNDSMKFAYNGISQFSSIRNRASSSQLDRLGFRSDGTNLNLRYQNNTLIADSLFSIKYNLSQANPDKYGFEQVKTVDEMSLYENRFSTQLAILTNSVYKDIDFTINTLDNQTNLLNNLTGLNYNYFTRLSYSPISQNTQLGQKVTVKEVNGKNQITYLLTTPQNSQIYVSMPNITFENDDQNNVQITVNHKTTNMVTDNAYSFFNIGYNKEAQTLAVTFQFSGNKEVSFNPPNFYALNLDYYTEAIEKLSTAPVSVQEKGNQVVIKYDSNKDTSLFLTLPYDKGWKAYQNNKEIPIRKAQKGFMAVDITKGKGEVTLIFIPDGLDIGLLCSLAGLSLYLSYTYFYRPIRKV